MRAGRRECRYKLGLVTVLRMLEQMGMPGNKSQLLRGAWWAHSRAVGAVG